MKGVEIIIEALTVGADRQHDRTADTWGEAACTEPAPCVFCQGLAALRDLIRETAEADDPAACTQMEWPAEELEAIAAAIGKGKGGQ